MSKRCALLTPGLAHWDAALALLVGTLACATSKPPVFLARPWTNAMGRVC